MGSVEKPPALKLILKVGSSSTPEHSDSPGPPVSNYSVATTSFVEDEEEVEKDAIVGRIEGQRRVFEEGTAACREGSEENSRISLPSSGPIGLGSSEGNRRVLTSGATMGGSDERHRRTKKKKKKRERDKHEKRHKRHHKVSYYFYQLFLMLCLQYIHTNAFTFSENVFFCIIKQ